jgi:hypothetical protein
MGDLTGERLGEPVICCLNIILSLRREVTDGLEGRSAALIENELLLFVLPAISLESPGTDEISLTEAVRSRPLVLILIVNLLLSKTPVFCKADTFWSSGASGWDFSDGFLVSAFDKDAADACAFGASSIFYSVLAVLCSCCTFCL